MIFKFSTTVLNFISLTKPLLEMADRSEIDMKLFGDNLHRLRKAKKYSLEKLANLAELELVQVSRIELGKTNPKLSTIFSLARALEINPKELFDFDLP